MKILDSRQMKEIDREAIGSIGLPGVVLMENAGLKVFQALALRFPHAGHEIIIVAAGKGNNGGDGFVVARHLFNSGYDVTVFLAGEKSAISGDAAVNLSIALKSGVPVVEMRDGSALTKFGKALGAATVVVDALFGTGLERPLEGFQARLVEAINASPACRIAVDLPSGLSADSFEIIGPAVRADLTVALAAPKVPHVFPPAIDLVGELLIADIGIPAALFAKKELGLELVEEKDIKAFFGPREQESHKGTYGHVLAVCGSVGKSGAAALAGKAALKAGAGLVTVATAADALAGLARSMAELMTEPLAGTAAGAVSKEALPRVLELLKGKDALLIGPGLTTGRSTAEFVRSLLPVVRVPMVIDADALNIIAGDLSILRRLKAPAVLTPHPGEFSRLCGLPTDEVLKRRLEVVPRFAAAHGVFVVLKGFRTIIATPDGRLLVNTTGNPGMASGGSGDVLSGLIASQAVQERDLAGAIASAVYVHGLAGDISAEALSEKAMTASDIIRFLPAAIKDIQREEEE